MAYGWTVETEIRNTSGVPREWLVRLYETEAETTSEWAIGDGGDKHGDPCPFETCRLVSYRSALLPASSGASIDPAMGKVTSWVPASLDHIWTNGAASVLVEVQPGTVVRLKPGSGRIIYGKSGVDAAADNIIHTEFTFVEGSA